MQNKAAHSVRTPPPCGQGNRMWPVFGERAQHRNRNRVVRATLESSRALARTIRIQNFHMRLPCPQGGGERTKCAALSCIKHKQASSKKKARAAGAWLRERNACAAAPRAAVFK